jgi:hypothetical protein
MTPTWANEALEQTAVQRVLTFQMIKTTPLAVTRVLGGGRSAWSR